jgi:hypothetical protein
MRGRGDFSRPKGEAKASPTRFICQFLFVVHYNVPIKKPSRRSGKGFFACHIVFSHFASRSAFNFGIRSLLFLATSVNDLGTSAIKCFDCSAAVP